MRIADRLVLVTGASSGIGAATAEAMARRGGRVVLVARSRTALEEVAARIGRAGGEGHVFAADLTDPAQVGAMAAAVSEQLGTPDILVNNAGAGRWLFLEETDPADAVRMMAAPYFAAAFTTRAFLPEMLRRRSGMIVNVTSLAAYAPWPGATGYAAGRWAMRGFTKALQADLRRTGVRAMLFTPGEVTSPYWEHNPGTRERIPGIARLYRRLTPEATGEALARAVERDRREVIVPWTLHVTTLVHRIAPRAVEWLVATTGARHV